MQAIKPSDVNLSAPIPLVGTLGRSEREVAAALLILACVDDGDEWRPVLPKALGLAMTKRKDAPEFPWLRNPFMRPDFVELVEKGYAHWFGPPHPDPSKGNSCALVLAPAAVALIAERLGPRRGAS